jgi:hypothetical protein
MYFVFPSFINIKGAFGFVHKGKLSTGEIIAIKTLREIHGQEEKLTVAEKIFKFRELLHEITILM